MSAFFRKNFRKKGHFVCLHPLNRCHFYPFLIKNIFFKTQQHPIKVYNRLCKHNEDKHLGTFNDTVYGAFSVQLCNPLFHIWQFKNLAVIGLRWVQKQTLVQVLLLSRQSSMFCSLYFLHTAPQNLLCCEIFNISLKD